ncbi:hypothetical protein WJX84_006536 [Apatococcus fuscideae]|uniref:Cilia- and flagella-associated protein 53 n=1 Tax=Apatococcus fuscideae TaxID=2026836 RepID=A0AAW1TEC2_9CHLO
MMKLRSAPDARVLKLRDYEDTLAFRKRAVQEGERLGQIAAWEEKTDERIHSTNVARIFGQLCAQREAGIDCRRRALAAKLLEESQLLQLELVKTEETPDQRRTKLAARARALAERKEAARVAEAQARLDQQFVESCDALRQIESRKRLQLIVQQQKGQVAERAIARQQEAEAEQVYDQLNMEEGRLAELRHDEDMQKARRMAAELVSSLQEQVGDARAMRAEEAEEQRWEVEEMKAGWAAQEAEAAAKERARRARQQQLQGEVEIFNRQKQEVDRAAAEAERQEDDRMLAAALQAAAEAEAREAAAKAAVREQELRFRKHLEAAMQHEAQDTAERDALIDRALAERQAKEDELRARQDAARRKLMAEVTAAQEADISRHEAERLEKRLRAAEVRDEQDREARLEEAQAAAKKAREYQSELEHRLQIQAQIAAKAQCKQTDALAQRMEQQQIAAAEAALADKMRITLAANDPRQYFGRRKVEWFY